MLHRLRGSGVVDDGRHYSFRRQYCNIGLDIDEGAAITAYADRRSKI